MRRYQGIILCWNRHSRWEFKTGTGLWAENDSVEQRWGGGGGGCGEGGTSHNQRGGPQTGRGRIHHRSDYIPPKSWSPDGGHIQVFMSSCFLCDFSLVFSCNRKEIHSLTNISDLSFTTNKGRTLGPRWPLTCLWSNHLYHHPSPTCIQASRQMLLSPAYLPISYHPSPTCSTNEEPSLTEPALAPGLSLTLPTKLKQLEKNCPGETQI